MIDPVAPAAIDPVALAEAQALAPPDALLRIFVADLTTFSIPIVATSEIRVIH